jgi:rRNA processing protein Krr1/Pno1
VENIQRDMSKSAANEENRGAAVAPISSEDETISSATADSESKLFGVHVVPSAAMSLLQVTAHIDVIALSKIRF